MALRSLEPLGPAGRARHARGSATAGIAVALALVACTVYAGWLASQLRATTRSVTVKGFAERPIESDAASWTVSLVVRSETMADAYARVQADGARVMAYLEEAGFARDAVSASAVALDARYRQNDKGWTTNEVELYELRQRVTVESADVARVERVAKEITALIREGVELTSEPPAFYYTKLDTLKIEMLGEASRDARARAGRIADEAGRGLGELVSASQGVFQITPVYSSEVSGGGMFDTASVRKTVRAVITASFAIR